MRLFVNMFTTCSLTSALFCPSYYQRRLPSLDSRWASSELVILVLDGSIPATSDRQLRPFNQGQPPVEVHLFEDVLK